MPTLYTSTIAREVKMRLLMMSSVLASSLARKVSLWIKIWVATEGHCSPSLTTLLEWFFGRWKILHPISHSSILMVVASRSQDRPSFFSFSCFRSWSITVRINVGEKTEPCFTPLSTVNGSDSWLWTRTWLVELVYQFLISHHHHNYMCSGVSPADPPAWLP